MIRLHQCTVNDLPALAKISKETFVAAFEKDNDPEDFIAYVNEAFSVETLKKQLENNDAFFYFVYGDDELVGYFKINQNGAQTELKDASSLELERIYVLPEHQGKNVGGLIVQEVVELAKKMGKKTLWLGVWEHNPKAIRFYEKHGFEKFGEHPYFIGNDEQTDWLMRLALGN
ncbi:GNAT family N-acetyltransferase [Allomuricauda sp. SCSIO 65647]|uniref:GNAT family N-acetyltransferase n=1 Tax=Allomuricauda sp. SCSIO 65647 TaxID=2908843 RepID=UPI001F45C064|nr:GNAT family N-acetyltransferase [Muricauda sp. SCSIO 65647]UJH68985.1 GNAT family N-acetyltransferase [Muricauda sp. SCSIO 65647]